MTVFTITDTDAAQMAALRQLSEENVIPFAEMMDRVRQVQLGIHVPGFDNRTIHLEWGWSITYTVEEHRPGTPCRHLSVASPKAGKVPLPMVMQMVLDRFGFTHRVADEQGQALEHPLIYVEGLSNGGHAVNVIEPLSGNYDELTVAMPVVASQHESMQ